MSVKRGRKVYKFVPITPDDVRKRREKIESQRAYIESLKREETLPDGATALQANKIDIERLEKQLESDVKALKYLEPKKGTSAERVKAQSEFNEAKEYIEKYALTQAELGKWPSSDLSKNSDYRKASDKCYANEVGNPMFSKMCNQLKRAAAILDPDNPDLRNINNYRKEC